MASLVQFNGPLWRLLPQSLADNPTTPAMAPEGRFHHSGQIAAYASLSAEGARVAMQRYAIDGVERSLVRMWLDAERVADERGNPVGSVVWQDIRATGKPSPTWALSDRARAAGAQAMLYSSRSRPELSHVVVFQARLLRAHPAPFEAG